MAFPKSFLFGAATSAYQIEGAFNEDGRGSSWWDEYSKRPGGTVDGGNGDVACDHYHRYESDLDLMSTLNLQAYRFSIAWPRVIPDGRGRVNAKGLDFYDRITDGVLKRGMKPFATLYHWDLPSPLAAAGGWTDRDCAKRFAEFADAATRRLGDRVHSWATLNEPRCASFVGFVEGRHAPGVEGRRDLALQTAHGMLLGHGLALPVIRANAPGAKAGVVLDVRPFYPVDGKASSAAAAHRGDGYFNRWFFDAIFKGKYPEDVVSAYGADMPRIEPGDMETISGKIDSVGINYYSRGIVREDTGIPYPHAADVRQESSEYTEMGWEVYPNGLRDMIVRIKDDYHPGEIFVAENGAAFEDELQGDRVHDVRRTEYFKNHLQAVSEAIDAGAPVSAYFAWSLMDNFEWGFGYSKRFGIVYVDYATQRRVPKDSALWYRDYIASCKRTSDAP